MAMLALMPEMVVVIMVTKVLMMRAVAIAMSL